MLFCEESMRELLPLFCLKNVSLPPTFIEVTVKLVYSTPFLMAEKFHLHSGTRFFKMEKAHHLLPSLSISRKKSDMTLQKRDDNQSLRTLSQQPYFS